ncbi:MAG TPA: PIN domain-containing protein [Thermoanaerobaculia bacterium]|nr:PIN domain-containing protein [Thermoanaerobaculia bacterium]
MSARSFFDSNILVYSDDASAPEKQARALDLLESCRVAGTGVISTQVLQEYFVTSTKKLKIPAEVARRKTELFSHFDLVRIGVEDILAAIDLHREHQISFWDALIIRAAIRSRCSVLLSEDLQDGRKIGGLEIVNPFR